MYKVVDYKLSKQIQIFKKNVEEVIGKNIIIFEPKYYLKKKESNEIKLSILIELDDEVIGDLYFNVDKYEGFKLIKINYPSKCCNYNNIHEILK